MNKRIGIITFHASLNHGTVLQALATQLAIQKLGFQSTIIDYRPKTYDQYDEIYCSRNRSRIKDKILALGFKIQKNKRLVRKERFCEFIKNNMILSSQRFLIYESLNGISNDYDLFISGSDQIWSEKVPEIKMAGEDAVLAYYLGFTQKPKISYASSIASMGVKDLSKYASYLSEYMCLSTREKVGADIIAEVTGKPVTLVLDPTLLIDSGEWVTYADSEPLIKMPYVLLYSLRNHTAEKNWESALKVFAKNHNFTIVVVAPYYEFPMKNAINIVDAGPKEFLNLYANATVVCTDTFHGTAFAVNFNKPFYSLGAKYWKEDIRKKALLNWLNLEERLIDDENDITSVMDFSCDFSKANEILKIERTKSFNYLKEAIVN